MLSVASTPVDPQLQYSLDKIKLPQETYVPGKVGLLDLLDRRRNVDAVTMDLIAHGDGGILDFAPEFPLTATTISALLPADDYPSKKNGATHGIAHVRLLGCNTASTAAGQAAILKLEERLDVPVCGTTNGIDARDYDDFGFKNTGLLCNKDNFPTIVDTETLVGRWRARFKDFTGDLRDLFRHLRPLSLPILPAPRWPLHRLTPTELDDVVDDSEWAVWTLGLQAATIAGLVVPSHGPGVPGSLHFGRHIDVLADGWALRLHPRALPFPALPDRRTVIVGLKSPVPLPDLAARTMRKLSGRQSAAQRVP